MILDRDDYKIGTDPGRSGTDFYDRDTGRSNFVSFLLGGVVVAGGLMAFLFYDGGALDGRDGPLTGLPSLQTPASPAAPSLATPGGTNPSP